MSTNVQELSVSELSRALKRTVEDAYAHVRVRGEISGFKRAGSGHLYMTLKDSDAVIDAVCWRGSANRLMARPEDGLEVIATGRLTTYPGRSKYQIVIEQMELAGEGALLKLLEDRRRALAAEGLFDDARKKPIPYLPEVIGVVTSPTGAVIRDILHRLADRFPRHVLLWPVLVQGEGAAEQVAAAIDGFNHIAPGDAVSKPDLLIVARGGGSLEDLWCFNEEAVVRAAAASEIPLISAVGHETDTTLIDFASDRRAPTPTAAAELAVPVRPELMADVADRTRRLIQAGHRGLDARTTHLEGLARGLPQPRRVLEPAMQRLDDLSERFANAGPRMMRDKTEILQARAARLHAPMDQIARANRDLRDRSDRLERALQGRVAGAVRDLSRLDSVSRMKASLTADLKQRRHSLERLTAGLEALSYHQTLNRGYALVRDADGALVRDPDKRDPGAALEIQFAKDKRLTVHSGGDGIALPSAAAAPGKRNQPTAKPSSVEQSELFT